MMWKVECSVKGCGSAVYEAPTQDAARKLAANVYLHAQQHLVFYHRSAPGVAMMLTKEALDEIKRAWAGGNRQSVVGLLLAHIDQQDAELNGRQATLEALDVEIISLRETVRFLNDAVRELEAKL